MALGGGGADPSPASTEFSDISINSPALGGPGGAAAAAAVVAAAGSGAVGKQQVAGGGSGRDVSGGLEVIGETKGCAASVSVVAVEAGASTASVAT